MKVVSYCCMQYCENHRIAYADMAPSMPVPGLVAQRQDYLEYPHHYDIINYLLRT